MLLAIAIAGCQRQPDIAVVRIPTSHEAVTMHATGIVTEPTAPRLPPRVELFRSIYSCEPPFRLQCMYSDKPCPDAARWQRCATPLVVAFDPIELQAPTMDRFAFEPGEPVESAWPTAATPWIALDRDGDGAITSGAELFGDSTGDANDGFEALAALDDNRDGVIDHLDAAFAKLLLWADDGDRKSTPDELRPLSNLIDSIPMAHDGARGSARLSAGRTVDVIDLYLKTRR